MKRAFILGLAFLFLSSAVFAEHAKVMPRMVGRFFAVPIFSFAPGEYNTDGAFERFDDGSIRLFNLGFALEFGVTDWFSAAVQWVPGWTPWSDLETATGIPNTNTNGVADIFLGAKIQIVGERAPVRSNMFRVAIGPGVIIPMPGPDFSEIDPTRLGQDAITFAAMDRHVFGMGARFFFDYVVNRNFFINLYNETLFFPVRQDINRHGPMFNLTRGGVNQTMLAAAGDPLDPFHDLATALGPAGIAEIMNISGEVRYLPRLTFEIEPRFSAFIANGVEIAMGLPLNYRFSPRSQYSFDFPDTLAPALSVLEPAFLGIRNTYHQHLLSIAPNVSMFFRRFPVPLEFKLQQSIPLWGRNNMAQHNLALQIRAYFAFGR